MGVATRSDVVQAQPRTGTVDMSGVSRRAVLGALPIFAATPALADETLHKIDYPKSGACGEATVPDKAAYFVKTFGGFSSGSCASEGYTVKEGTEKGTGEKDSDREYTIYSK